jgi:hypothetical protein
VRSALYWHLGDSGERLFIKLDEKRPARYGLRSS